MVRRQFVFNALIVLIVIMLLINGYTLFLFIRGVSNSEALDDFVQNLQLFNDQNVFYNETVPTIRFKVIPETFENAGKQLGILVPVHLPSSHFLTIAQKVRVKLHETKLKGGPNPPSSKKGTLLSVSRLKRLLMTRTVSTGSNSQRSDPQTVWKGIAGWPFSDSLRLMNLAEALKFASEAKIIEAKNSGRGTQLKLEVTLEGGEVALLKPRWYPRNIRINGTTYSGKDRHFGEIAAFYLNLILGYNNGPIIVGRRVNLLKEIIPVADQPLINTIFVSQNGSHCFYGACLYCSEKDPVCAIRDQIETALVLLMETKFRTVANPWRRTYREGKHATWEVSSHDFCQRVMKDQSPPKRLQGILDIVAVSIFDFLIGNGDRHHFEMHLSLDSNWNSHSNKIILMDNGKSFGNSEEDFLDILAPLFQCCKIRQSLLLTLNKFQGVLGKSLDSLSQVDSLHPLLSSGHLRALDRRLDIVLAVVQVCQDNQQQNHPNRKVIY